MLLAQTFRAFRHRDYAIFWSGLFFGHTGTLIQTTAQSWLIFQLTDSPFYLGLEGFCLGLPRLLFSAVGGAVVDRADRKLIFIITQVAFLLMALFLGVMTHFGAIRVWQLLVVSALDWFFCLLRTAGSAIDLARCGAPDRPAERCDPLPDGFQRLHAVRSGDRRPFDSGHRHRRLLLHRYRRKSFRPHDYLSAAGSQVTAPRKVKRLNTRHARRIACSLAHTDLSGAFYRARHRDFLHQTLYSIHAGIRARYSPRWRARIGATADGAGRRGDSRRSDAGLHAPLSESRIACFSCSPRDLARPSCCSPRRVTSPSPCSFYLSQEDFKPRFSRPPRCCSNFTPMRPIAAESCRSSA